jgi:hypothetical protein
MTGHNARARYMARRDAQRCRRAASRAIGLCFQPIRSPGEVNCHRCRGNKYRRCSVVLPVAWHDQACGNDTETTMTNLPVRHDDTGEKPDAARRRLLLRLGLAAAAVYVAPLAVKIGDEAQAGSRRVYRRRGRRVARRSWSDGRRRWRGTRRSWSDRHHRRWGFRHPMFGGDINDLIGRFFR